MTAIIYEIKHNSALRQVGQLSRSLNKSSLFTHNNLIMKSQRKQEVSHSHFRVTIINTLIFHMYWKSTPCGTCCKLCYLQATPPQAVFFCDDRGLIVRGRVNYSPCGVIAPDWMNSAEWEMPVSGQYACSRGIRLRSAAACLWYAYFVLHFLITACERVT